MSLKYFDADYDYTTSFFVKENVRGVLGPDFSDSRNLMIIFCDFSDPIFNSMDPNWSLKHL